MADNKTGTPAKAHVAPEMIRIERGPATEKLYALEEKRSKAFEAAAVELAKVLKHDKREYWTRTVPQALFDMLECYEKGAALAAARAFVAWHEARAAASEVQP